MFKSEWLTTAVLLLIVTTVFLAPGMFNALAATNQPAHDGDFDTSFDGDGIVTTDFGSDHDQANAMVLQPDGKIVVAGRVWAPGQDDFGLARYNLDGSLDASFDNDGKVTTDFDGIGQGANALALQTDGKIIAAGSTPAGSTDDFALVRYNEDGSLDTSFDGDGKVTTGFGDFGENGRGIAIQTDGKIIVVGSTWDVSVGANNFAISRYNTDGSLDPEFDSDGKVITDLGGDDTAVAVAIQPDHKVVVAGSSSYDSAIARYNPDGSLDTSFDGDGKLTISVTPGGDGFNTIILLSDQKIIVAGSGGGGGFNMVRFNPNGSLDPGFGDAGIVTTGFGPALASGLHGSKIVVAGYFGAYDKFFRVARYNANGQLDPTFGNNGIVRIYLGANDLGWGSGLAIQPDTKIVVAGTNYSDFGVVRLLGGRFMYTTDIFLPLTLSDLTIGP